MTDKATIRVTSHITARGDVVATGTDSRGQSTATVEFKLGGAVCRKAGVVLAREVDK